MGVNETKTKCMSLEHNEYLNLKLNEKTLKTHKIINIYAIFFLSVRRISEDIFCDTYTYVCGQGRRAIFCIRQRLRNNHPVHPAVMFNMYEMLVKPVLAYGSDVWRYNKKSLAQIGKIMLHYCRCVLKVKASTSNIITLGECDILPPGVYSQIAASASWIVCITYQKTQLQHRCKMSYAN